MIINKTTNTCGKHIAGFQCDMCKKTEITGDFPAKWYRDDLEMLCFDCLFDAYLESKSKNTEYDLVLKKITETITKINDENSEDGIPRKVLPLRKSIMMRQSGR